MNTRFCIVCKKEKPLSEFNKGKYKNYIGKGKTEDTYKYTQNKCRDCQHKYWKKYHTEKYKNDTRWREQRKRKTRKWYWENRERASKTHKESHERLRLEVLRAYGGKVPVCKCCGESEIKFLAIDHIDGSGASHRRELGSQNICRWLKKNNFPSGFQVLCHNCNLAKGFYGVCPHQEKKRI